MKRYRSNRQAERIRAKACECAAILMASQPWEEDSLSRVHAAAVIFESYMAHGAGWTRKHAIDANRPKATLHVIPPKSR